MEIHVVRVSLNDDCLTFVTKMTHDFNDQKVFMWLVTSTQSPGSEY